MLQIGGQATWVWQAAAAFGLLFVSTIGVAAFRREKLRRHLPGFKRIASAIMFTLVALSFLGYAWIALGQAGSYGFHLYLAILCLLLVICCTMFVLVIASLMQAEIRPSEQMDEQAAAADRTASATRVLASGGQNFS